MYLQLEFNKNGRDVLKQLSTGEYKTKEETDETETEQNNTEDENAVEAEANISTNEESSSEENSNTSEETETEDTTQEEDAQKKITLSIDGTELITTSFDDPIEDGIINLSMGQTSTDASTISNTLESTSTVAILLNNGEMPLTYRVTENKYVKTDITSSIILKCVIGICIIAAIGLILLIVKYKAKGLIAAIGYIGFVAVDLLIVRYTNVAISIETIVAEVIILAINYMLTMRLLKINEKDKELKQKAYKNELLTWIKNLVPVFLITIIFVFIRVEKIAVFGMFTFWGIFLSIIYNYLLTKDMLDE